MENKYIKEKDQVGNGNKKHQNQQNTDQSLTGQKRAFDKNKQDTSGNKAENTGENQDLKRFRKEDDNNNSLIKPEKDMSRFFIPPQKCTKSALTFKVVAQFNRCRVGMLTLPHGPVRTPVYMPVGTKGAMKGVLESTLDSQHLIDCDIMLNNTYHLFLKPGEEILEKVGGAHKFMSRQKNILTDSGGFQIVSLGDLNTLDEEGVTFKSHIDGKVFELTPERSMEIQNIIGSDIMMQLDDVVPPVVSKERVEEAMYRSVRWLDRCIVAHKNVDTQNLFAIVQGGTDKELREECCKQMIARDLPGYAIGGMAGGEDKQDFWKTVAQCCEILPADKPRYVMGIGYAEDCMISALLGADMFDCVFATRTARFGTAFTKYGMIKIKKEQYLSDFGPISEGCTCYTCRNYSLAYVSNMFKKDISAIQLISIHNIHFLIHSLRSLRQSVIDGTVESFAVDFFKNYFRDEKDGVPQWIKDALKTCGIDMPSQQ